MTDPKNLLDRQLSGVTWTQGDRRAVLCAIGKEKPVMKKKFATLLTAVLILALLAGAAVAASRLWGVEDFADRSGIPLPVAPVQQQIPQQFFPPLPAPGGKTAADGCLPRPGHAPAQPRPPADGGWHHR